MFKINQFILPHTAGSYKREAEKNRSYSIEIGKVGGITTKCSRYRELFYSLTNLMISSTRQSRASHKASNVLVLIGFPFLIR